MPDLAAAMVSDPLIAFLDTPVLDAIAQMSQARSSCNTIQSQPVADVADPADLSVLVQPGASTVAHLNSVHLDARASCVVVMDRGRVVGIFTERDVVRLTAQEQPISQLTMQAVMATPVVTIQDTDLNDFFTPIRLLQRHRIRHLPVLDQNQCLLGLLTHETLRQSSRPIDLLRLRLVEEVMTTTVVSATPEASIFQIAQQMAAQRVSSVVIVAAPTAVADPDPSPLSAPGLSSTESSITGSSITGSSTTGSSTTGSSATPTSASIPVGPVGIITERDLVQLQALGVDLHSYPAEAVMSSPVFTVSPQDSLLRVQQLMAQHFIHRLVVTGDQGDVLGIVTQSSVLQALNPIEIYKLVDVLESKVLTLEAEKLALLENRTVELEAQVKARTMALEAKARQDQLLNTLANQIRSSLSLTQILQTTVQGVRSWLDCDRVIIYQFQPDWSGLVIAEALVGDGRSLLHSTIHDPCINADFLADYRHGKVRVVNDIHIEPMADCHRDFLAGLQIRAKLMVALVVEGQLWGLMVASYCRTPYHWTTDEIELIRQVSFQVSLALQQATAYEKAQHELTKRRQMEAIQAETIALLRASEHRYASLAASSPVGIFRTNMEGYCTYVNDRYCQISGLAVSDAMGAHWQHGLHPDDRQLVIDTWRQALATQAEFQMEYRFQHVDGMVVWVYGQAVPERDELGHFLGYVGTITDISDRKRSEEALRNSEAHYRALIQAIPDLILRVNRAGIYQEFVAQPTFRVLGDLANFVGSHVAESLPTPLAEKRMEYIHKALDSQTVQFYEHDLSIGTHIQIEEVRVVPYSQDEVLLLVRDISDRKRNERKLAASEAQSRAILAAIPDLMVRIGADGRYREFISHNQTLDLVPDHQARIGRLMEELLPPEVAERQWYYLRCALATGELQVYEQQIEINGRISYEEVRVMQSADDEMLFMIRDISDRARLEAERKQAALALQALNQSLEQKVAERTAELQSSQAKFQRLVDDIGDQFVVFSHTGLTGVLTYVTDGIESVFGVPKEQAIGHAWIDVVQWTADSLAVGYKSVMAMVEHQVDFHQFDMAFIHPNGEERTIHVSVHPVRDQANQLIAVEGIIEDISDRKQAERYLQRTNEELLRATRLKDEFLANMSHELRTPLNAILGMAEALQEKIFGTINPQQLEALQTIERSGNHLLDLINDILDVAKIESGQLTLETAPTSVNLLCQSSVTFVKQQALKKRIQLTTTIPRALPDLLVDERRIRQVLINLLNNAVKFTPEGGQICLEVMPSPLTAADPAATENDTAPVPPFLRIAITDTGIGIAPEHIPKLFQPFIQVDSALNRQYEGTGLGLALVKRLVDLHGGQVGLTSQVGVGSCFTIDLPCCQGTSSLDLAAPVATAAPPPDAAIAPTTPSMATPLTTPLVADQVAPLILLVEDNRANIHTISGYLTAKGYRTVLATNGAEAIAIAQTEHPDLILMDIQMPGMDGIEAIQHIRRDPNLSNIPIIALTALAMAGDRDRCFAAGANEYISKPIKLKELTQVIQSLLDPPVPR